MVMVCFIVGIRFRGKIYLEDEQLVEELLNDFKEIVEYVMLVDLGCNDLGWVCVQGLVKVNELMVIECYFYVMYIVSNVVGELVLDKIVWDFLKVCFFVGIVSGVLKIRVMEIINELELEWWGFYFGVYGYYDFEGQLNMAIVIWIMVVQEQLDGVYWVLVQIGVGIVVDFDF